MFSSIAANPLGARLISVAAVLIAMVSIASGASYAKSLFSVIGPVGVTTMRLVIASAILSVVLSVWRAPLNARSLAIGCAYGASIAVMNLFMYLSFQYLPLGIALAIQFLGPLTVAVATSRAWTHFAWIAVALGGLALLLPIHSANAHLEPIGIGFALMGAVGWGSYIVLGRRAGALLGERATAVGMIFATMLVLPLGIWQSGADLVMPALLLPLLAVALLSSAIPFPMEMFALRRLPPRTYSVLTSCEPGVGAIIGLILLGEQLSLITCAGIALVITASLGMTLTDRR